MLIDDNKRGIKRSLPC